MELLSDETWQQLDPRAGRLDEDARSQLIIALLVVVAVLAVGFGVWRSGLLYPRIETRASDGTGWTTAGPGHRFSIGMVLTNQGLTARHVTIGRSGRGLELVRVEGLPGGTLDASAVAQVTLDYRVTDCSAVQTGAWPVPVTAKTYWGHATVMVEPDPIMVESLSSGDEESVEPLPTWQQTLARTACLPSSG